MENAMQKASLRPASRTGMPVGVPARDARATRNRLTIKTKTVEARLYSDEAKPKDAPARILFVAGDSMHTQLVKMILCNQNYSIQAVQEAGASNAALAVEVPNLVLLDWDTNGIDGEAVLRGLRGNSETRRVPVILMTNRGMSESARRELAGFGVHWILEKPIVATSLPKLIERTIAAANQPNPSSAECRYQRSALLVECGQTASGVLWKAVW